MGKTRGCRANDEMRSEKTRKRENEFKRQRRYVDDLISHHKNK